MSAPGGRRGVLAASGAALVLPVAVGALALTLDPEPPAAPAASPARLRTGAAGDEPARPGRRGVSILQIGDSHTAADQFTGTVRQVLQQRFGAGGIGYLPAGLPHPGVRSTRLTLAASPGWRYAGIQRAPRPEGFGLSGFNAGTARAGETLTVASPAPEPYGTIAIEARTGPEAGSLVVEVDDVPRLSASLAAGTPGPTVLEVRAPGPGATFRRLVVRTREERPVTLSALAITRPGSGLTYSSVGYPGATVEVVGRLAAGALAADLRRLAPDIVVLAFGTNEGFDAKLDPAAYRERYRAALREIRRAVPGARLVMIGPPQGERPPPACKPAEGRPCPPPAAEPAPAGAEPGACPQRPAQLDRVRAVQRGLAQAEGIPFWDWWAIMPEGCGAARWAGAEPPLMARDRVHFTRAGYRAGGEAFAAFIEPEVRAALRGDDAVSHH